MQFFLNINKNCFYNYITLNNIDMSPFYSGETSDAQVQIVSPFSFSLFFNQIVPPFNFGKLAFHSFNFLTSHHISNIIYYLETKFRYINIQGQNNCNSKKCLISSIDGTINSNKKNSLVIF